MTTRKVILPRVHCISMVFILELRSVMTSVIEAGCKKDVSCMISAMRENFINKLRSDEGMFNGYVLLKTAV